MEELQLVLSTLEAAGVEAKEAFFWYLALDTLKTLLGIVGVVGPILYMINRISYHSLEEMAHYNARKFYEAWRYNKYNAPSSLDSGRDLEIALEILRKEN
jgi:hypothetical protein